MGEEDDQAVAHGPRVMGIGVGLFLLILIWAVVLLLLLLFSRIAPTVVSAATVSLAIIVTVVLLSLPRYPPQSLGGDDSNKDQQQQPEHIYDVMFIGRICLILFMAVSALVTGFVIVTKHCTMAVYAQRIRKVKLS